LKIATPLAAATPRINLLLLASVVRVLSVPRLTTWKYREQSLLTRNVGSTTNNDGRHGGPSKGPDSEHFKANISSQQSEVSRIADENECFKVY